VFTNSTTPQQSLQDRQWLANQVPAQNQIAEQNNEENVQSGPCSVYDAPAVAGGSGVATKKPASAGLLTAN